MTTVVLVAHGSRDPRSAATITRLADRVRAARPDDDVRLAFLELSLPSLEQVLAGVETTADDTVVVPLLLGDAYHARTDIPNRIDRAWSARSGRPAVAGTLGAADLDRALTDRIEASPEIDTWLLVGAGSSRTDAVDAVHETAARVEARTGRWVRAGFASAEPSVDAVRIAVVAAGAGRIGVLPWFLAPGRLLDRALAVARDCAVVAPPLADDPVTAAVVSSRIDSAIAGRSAATLAVRA